MGQNSRATPGLWNKGVSRTYTGVLTVIFKSPQVGFEPTTNRLTADHSTTELLRNNGRFDLIEFHSRSQPMTNMSSKLPSTLLSLPSPSSRYGRRRRRSQEEGISNNWFYYGTTHHVHIDLLCASASSTGIPSPIFSKKQNKLDKMEEEEEEDFDNNKMVDYMYAKNIGRILLRQSPEWYEDFQDWNREIYLKCSYNGLQFSKSEFPKTIHGRMNQEKPMTVPSTRKDLMIVNMGPHHPSMHGVLRLIVTLDGEDVIDCEPILGYLHRDIGAQTPFFYIFRERELIYDLFEAATGMRMMHNFFRIGGVAADLPYGWIDKCLDFCDYFLTGIAEYQKLITRNPIFLERVEGVGIIGGEEAINWGFRDQCYELPEYNGIFVKLIIMSVTMNLIGKSNGKKRGIH
ncbi:hypothetical protein E3N88_12091 [Mikania micrantha]|uniref:Protein TIC 214 n=1 Tax=Mikania micrantha TaxID=192012 RepID=A0A5N6P4U8_9ASTR|nr:hypothetical protein E3N88_12091 [Mikania micrantha]